MSASPTVSFLTDYGHVDEFVGVCHGVMLRIEPSLRIIDLTHDIPPHDVRAGALALARSVQYLPECVVLGVVDPGVGSDRRAVAVAVGGGYFVGPDNGLLAPAVALAGGAHEAVGLTNPDFHLPAPGPTFDGRDVFAPAAAHLAAGIALAELGDTIDPLSLQPGLLPLSRTDADGVHGEVLWVDRFGNAQLNIDPDELVPLGADPGAVIEVRIRDAVRPVRRVVAYGEARPGELVLLADSYGLLSLAVNQGSATAEAALSPGTPVTFAKLEE